MARPADGGRAASPLANGTTVAANASRAPLGAVGALGVLWGAALLAAGPRLWSAVGGQALTETDRIAVRPGRPSSPARVVDGEPGRLPARPCRRRPVSTLARPALLFYLGSYALTNVAAFAVAAALPDRRDLSGYHGLARAQPMLSGALLVALLGLVGTPPTAVFLGKVSVATAAWDGDGHGWRWPSSSTPWSASSTTCAGWLLCSGRPKARCRRLSSRGGGRRLPRCLPGPRPSYWEWAQGPC